MIVQVEIERQACTRRREEVQAAILLSIVSDTFDVAQQCNFPYFLHLPQTLDGGGRGKHVFGKGDVSDSITIPRKSLFSNATNLYSKFSVTPVRNENSSQGSALLYDIVITTQVATAEDQGGNIDEDAKSHAGGSKFNDKADESNSSHGSFDMKKISHTTKIAQLLSNRRNHGSKSTRSYHGPAGLLDDQAVFDQCTIRWNIMVLLVDNTASTLIVTQSEEID